jgi:hypothetical protein
MNPLKKLRVFLCHSSQDKPIVRELYQRLNAEGWIDPWLDEEKLLPGQDWDMEIEKAVEAADAVIVCLSKNSVSKEGYIQKEFRYVLDIALEKPEDTIFIIPIRLDDCQIPRRIRSWQYVNYFPTDHKNRAYHLLESSLNLRANNQNLDMNRIGSSAKNQEEKTLSGKPKDSMDETSGSPTFREYLDSELSVMRNKYGLVEIFHSFGLVGVFEIVKRSWLALAFCVAILMFEIGSVKVWLVSHSQSSQILAIAGILLANVFLPIIALRRVVTKSLFLPDVNITGFRYSKFQREVAFFFWLLFNLSIIVMILSSLISP